MFFIFYDFIRECSLQEKLKATCIRVQIFENGFIVRLKIACSLHHLSIWRTAKSWIINKDVKLFSKSRWVPTSLRIPENHLVCCSRLGSMHWMSLTGDSVLALSDNHFHNQVVSTLLTVTIVRTLNLCFWQTENILVLQGNIQSFYFLTFNFCFILQTLEQEKEHQIVNKRPVLAFAFARTLHIPSLFWVLVFPFA